MIPLRDNIPSSRFPIMTVSLILVSSVIFLYEATLPQAERDALFLTFGMIPSRVIGLLPTVTPDGPIELRSLITSIFLHGSWVHIIGNMLFLWVFGDNVEDLMGPWRFLGLYLATGAVAGLSHAITAPGSMIPTIGASGAVAGVLGAYYLNFRKARVLTLVPLGFFLTTIEIPATFFLLIWFGIQLLYGLASLGVAAETGVAWWAHIGGFVAGGLLIILFKQRRTYA